jgi:hypothetical protein
MDADVLMPALNRSLEAMKQPAARVSVMEFVVLFMGVGRVAGLPSNTIHIRHWVSKNIPLLLDKNPNVRQMAGKALATIYAMDPHTVRGSRAPFLHVALLAPTGAHLAASQLSLYLLTECTPKRLLQRMTAYCLSLFAAATGGCMPAACHPPGGCRCAAQPGRRRSTRSG